MSWYLKSFGTRAAVKAAVLVSSMPELLKQHTAAILDSTPVSITQADNSIRPNSHAFVESAGHIDSWHGGNITVHRVELIVPAAEPVAEPKPADVPPPDQAAQ